MKINTRQLSSLIQEANTLSSRPKWSKEDERRNAYLLAAISAVKVGADLDEIQAEHINEIERANGLPETRIQKPSLTAEQRAWARGWRAFAEQRDQIEGSPMINHIGTYSNLGYFVPTGYWDTVFAQMAQADFLYNEDDVTVLKTDTGNPITVPVYGDISVVATPTIPQESGDQTEADLYDPGQAVVGAWSFKTPRYIVSIEAMQDMVGATSVANLFIKFASDRLARGISQLLLTGNGVNQPLGLLTALSLFGAPIVVASGSSANTGNGLTGANSIGTADLAALYSTLNPAYMASPKCAWFMSIATLGSLIGMVDKQGQPVNVVKFDDGTPSIFGLPVKTSPSMPGIGVSNTPIILGDGTYWLTRLVNSGDSGIKSYAEGAGLVEYGKVAWRSFLRADGALLAGDPNSPSPFVVLRNHS